jgi:hypothetical protein
VAIGKVTAGSIEIILATELLREDIHHPKTAKEKKE